MWSVGCIMVEIILSRPLFLAKSEMQLLSKIYKILQSPNSMLGKLLATVAKMNPEAPRLSILGLDLLEGLLTLNPSKRITVEAALEHG